MGKKSNFLIFGTYGYIFDTYLVHIWYMDGTWMVRGWYVDGTWMVRGWYGDGTWMVRGFDPQNQRKGPMRIILTVAIPRAPVKADRSQGFYIKIEIFMILLSILS